MGSLDPFQLGFRPQHDTMLVPLHKDLLSEATRESVLVITLDLFADLSVITLPLGSLLSLEIRGFHFLLALVLLLQSPMVPLGNAVFTTWDLSYWGLTRTQVFNIYMMPLGDVIWGFGFHCHQYIDTMQLYLHFASSEDDARWYLSAT